MPYIELLFKTVNTNRKYNIGNILYNDSNTCKNKCTIDI